jgi:hypothetical protein
MNEDGENVAFAYNEAARPTFAAEDITQVSPNVMNMDGESELRADSTTTSNHCEIFAAEDIAHVPPNAQHEQQTSHFMVHMDELLNMDKFPDLFDDNSLSNIESLLQFEVSRYRPMGEAIRYCTDAKSNEEQLGMGGYFLLGMSYFEFEGIQILFKFEDIYSLLLILCK